MSPEKYVKPTVEDLTGAKGSLALLALGHAGLVKWREARKAEANEKTDRA